MCQWQCPKLASTRVLVYMPVYFMLPEQLVTYIPLRVGSRVGGCSELISPVLQSVVGQELATRLNT